ncbi:MAG TPA: YihY/virulence factor BrkB family protein [Solirubrobacteraceae bacterium]|nr:YihY/virulence factor BrkB family protein [Solirubrobacteraceae bacterium]
MRLLRRTGAVAEGALGEFVADGCTTLAAAISYYALLAVFPLAIIMVAVAGLVFDDDDARAQIIDTILDRVPLRDEAGRVELQNLLGTVTESAGATGAVGVVFLLVAASGVMGALRFALNTVWDVEDPRPPLRGKALDVLLVLGAGLVVGLSLTLTFLVRKLSRASETELGAVGSAIGDAVLALGQVLPAVLALAIFTALFRFLPSAPVRLRHALAGGVIAAVGYEGTKTLFALYLENVANLSAVYASLGTVVAFLVFVWLTTNVFLYGAEVAQQLPVQTGEADPDAESLGRRVTGALRGLVAHPPTRPGESEGPARPGRTVEPSGSDPL